MSRVPNRNTSPELTVRSRLFQRGFRFRLHVKRLPGAPDVVLTRFRMAVFVHGCFWHGHACRRGQRPASNTEFWAAKLDRNITRDRESVRLLAEQGWRTHVIWTCQLETDLKQLIDDLERLRNQQH